MNFRLLFSLIVLGTAANLASNAQSMGYGKSDTIKKVIPPQVYGRPKKVKKADSAAVAKRMQELDQMSRPDQIMPAGKSPSQETLPPPIVVEKRKQVDPISNKDNKVVIITQNENGESVEQEVKTGSSAPMPDKNQGPILTAPNGLTSSNARTSDADIEEVPYGWSLLRCVNYAREHNLQVKSAELNERLARLQFQQTRSSKLPNINADASVGESYGRSIDPTSNQFVTKGFVYNSLSLNSSVLLFGWFQKKYQSEQNRFDVLSTLEANQQLKDDISLNVATGFLRVLMAREQVKISEAQLKLDQEQYEQTVHFAEAGKIPELNVSQMQSQMANDSSAYIGNQSEEQLALLQLRALMNFDFNQPFTIQTPDINAIETADSYSLMSPESIFNQAVQNQHRMKYNHLKLASARKALYLAKSAQYPQLALFGSLGTNYSSNVKQITGQTYTGDATLGYVTVGAQQYPINVPQYSYQTTVTPIFDQYNQNLRANAGLSLSVPILNGRSARGNIERAKIGIRSQEIAYEVDQQKLKQDIYTAHQQVIAARQKFVASQKAEEAAKRALEFAKKRYAIGMINTFEYTSVQNTFNQTTAAALSAKYDLIFKLKVLDYYLGNQIKL